MTEREMMERMVEISKREGAMLAAIEALGRTIVELRDKLQSKDFDIDELKRKLADAERRVSNGKD